MRNRQAAVIFILVTVLLDILAMGLIIPVLPKLILDFLGGKMTSAADWNGWFGLVFALMQFFFSPVLGVLSDRFGRRPIILLSNLGLGLDYVVMALAPSLAWLFLGRIISGITSSSIPTAMAYIADVTPKEKRAGAFGLIGVAFGIGFTFGPAIGGLAGDINPPIAGPNVNPMPNATPIRPNAPARFSFGVTSAMYAIAVGILEVVIPEIIRPRKSQF